jgi:hypothetical protein
VLSDISVNVARSSCASVIGGSPLPIDRRHAICVRLMKQGLHASGKCG